MNELTKKLETLVLEENKSISVRWLSVQEGIKIDEAKAALRQFAEKYGNKVHATYYVDGVDAQQTRVVSLVGAGRLPGAIVARFFRVFVLRVALSLCDARGPPEVKSKLSDVATHVFSVQASAPLSTAQVVAAPLGASPNRSPTEPTVAHAQLGHELAQQSAAMTQLASALAGQAAAARVVAA